MEAYRFVDRFNDLTVFNDSENSKVVCWGIISWLEEFKSSKARHVLELFNSGKYAQCLEYYNKTKF